MYCRSRKRSIGVSNNRLVLLVLTSPERQFQSAGGGGQGQALTLLLHYWHIHPLNIKNYRIEQIIRL